MSHTDTNSSPLSSVPETSPASATPPTSSPDRSQQLPETSPRATTPTPAEGTMAAGLASPTLQPGVPPQLPTSNKLDMAKQSTSAPPPLKRGREDDDEEGSPPPKKITTSPTSKGKAKSAPKKSAAKKATSVPQPSRNRSSRQRKAPERFEDVKETKPLQALPVKKAASKVFDPVYITTNSTSRLGKADVYHMLLEDAAWSSLSSEQQATLISMLPATSANTTLLTAINDGETDKPRPQAFNKSNDCFRTDVAKFQQDLKNGHLAKTWQAAAEQAVIERAAGEYDAWKAEEAESWWGQKSKPA